jgi:hypothetical protein
LGASCSQTLVPGGTLPTAIRSGRSGGGMSVLLYLVFGLGALLVIGGAVALGRTRSARV